VNEQELRQAMRTTMATASAPPPMNETPVLDAARRAIRRRRARWAGVSSAVAVVAVVGVAVAVVVATSGGADPGGRGGAAPAGTTTSSAGNDTSNVEPTKPSWPDGQTDRTARSGPHFDQGVALLEALVESVPPGYESPPGLKYEDPSYAGAGYLRGNQAQYIDTFDGVQVWTYDAQLPLVQGKGVGELYVEVTSPGTPVTGEGCSLGTEFWGMKATCAEHTVSGEKVGVFTPAADERRDFDSWAGYRDDDGRVVFVAQSAGFVGSGKPGLTEPPLAATRLAQLAADPRFRLG
jgi:hypothetical protein